MFFFVFSFSYLKCIIRGLLVCRSEKTGVCLLLFPAVQSVFRESLSKVIVAYDSVNPASMGKVVPFVHLFRQPGIMASCKLSAGKSGSRNLTSKFPIPYWNSHQLLGNIRLSYRTCVDSSLHKPSLFSVCLLINYLSRSWEKSVRGSL
jgi:hypothetical protein